MKNMWIFNTIKFRILESFLLNIWYVQINQEGSHVKYELAWKTLIVPKYKEISRWTLNNIFKIISLHKSLDKIEVEKEFLKIYKKNK